jgi:hypothetical protein
MEHDTSFLEAKAVSDASASASRLALWVLALALAATIGFPGLLPGQTQGDGFLFQPPAGNVTFHVGVARPRAGSDIFTDTRSLLTLEKGDFNSISLGAEYAWNLIGQIDLVASIGYAGSNKRSEFRDWVDQDELPIEQNTRFTRVPLTAGARLYLLPRGRSIGSHVWFPSAVAPYLSAGGGVVWYSFKQTGDFVDFQDQEIITDKLESAGFAPLVHVGGGMEFSLTPRLLIAADARYSIARAAMKEDFSGYDDIDLAGLAATVGIRIRF